MLAGKIDPSGIILKMCIRDRYADDSLDVEEADGEKADSSDAD